MGYNRANGGAAIVAAARLMLGCPYVLGGAHDWEPGDPVPTNGDCSGGTHFATAYCGCDVGAGTADTQWQTHRGGIVPGDEDLEPGDIGAFLGAENIAGYAGHTATVVTYDAATRTGTIIGPYDGAMGDVILPFNRDQPDNGDNGLGVLGFYRPSASLPAPPIPPQPLEQDMIWCKDTITGAGEFLVRGDKKAGLPNPGGLAAVAAQGIVEKVLTADELKVLVSVPWGQL